MKLYTSPRDERPSQAMVLALAIERHLARHPHAADSVDGVARWWLGTLGVNATTQDVEQALTLLVTRQRLRSVTLADGTVLYSRPAARASA